MTTATLPYGRQPRSLRRLPWRHIFLLSLAAYTLFYIYVRMNGQITHAWTNPNTKAPDPDFNTHVYSTHIDSFKVLFIPAAVVESALRDLALSPHPR